MTQTLKTSLFQQALEAVEALSLEDQAILLDTLSHRLNQRQRQQLVEEIQEVQKEYQAGQVKFGSVNDFLAELDN
jgi:ABC-type branched-subunit amino acid transport system ATPase component